MLPEDLILTGQNLTILVVRYLLMVTMMLVVRNTSKGVKFNTSTAVSGIKGKVVTTRNIYTQVEKRIRDVDTVVLVAARESDDKLYKETKSLLKELRESVEDLREQAPINSFIGVVFSAF